MPLRHFRAYLRWPPYSHRESHNTTARNRPIAAAHRIVTCCWRNCTPYATPRRFGVTRSTAVGGRRSAQFSLWTDYFRAWFTAMRGPARGVGLDQPIPLMMPWPTFERTVGPGAPEIQWLADMQALSIFGRAMPELCGRLDLRKLRGSFGPAFQRCGARTAGNGGHSTAASICARV